MVNLGKINPVILGILKEWKREETLVRELHLDNYLQDLPIALLSGTSNEISFTIQCPWEASVRLGHKTLRTLMKRSSLW